jgi:sugar O-acyltransferase (sialic acid O-acetyltransferase NeuD family)
VTGVVVLGAGGHAKVVADAAAQQGLTVLAFVDERASEPRTTPAGVPVLARLDDAPEGPVALGIGDNAARLARHRALAGAGREPLTVVHPSAVVAPDVLLGAGTIVAAGVVVNSDTVVGQAAVLNTGCSVDHDCVLGDGVHVAPGARLAGGVHVGEGAMMGIASCAVPLVSIGAWAVCGAAAAVVRDVPPHTTVRGVPAR